MKNFQFHWLLAISFLTYNPKRHLCDELFLEPKVLGEFEESFIMDDLEYIFSSHRITWEEAEIGCAAIESGSLAIIDTTDKAKFLALALAETDLIVEDLWVGATAEVCPDYCNATNSLTPGVRCFKGKCFKWFTGDYVVGEFMLPRRHEVSFTDRNCLSFARNDHQEPSFVDLYCRLLRPYMCQRPAEEEYGKMIHRGWIRIGNYEYAIFYSRLTWRQSVRECFMKHRAHLADFRIMKEVAGIGKYLLTGRPSLENAWIGGYYKNDRWRYISIDDIIPDKQDPSTLYPPWVQTNGTKPAGGCLLLDRHLDDTKKLVFIPERCQKKLSYICSRKISGDELSPFEVIVVDEVCYTVFYTPKTWNAASDTCASRNSWLVEVTEDKLDSVLYIMGENRTEINHIWIGAKLNLSNVWYWVNSNDSLESNSSIFRGYPPWLDEKFDQKYACLNMDRENHNKALFYGVYCNERQPFVCQQYDIENCVSAVTEKEKEDTTSTVPPTTTVSDPWKWKWPPEKNEYNRIKPYFEWTTLGP